MAVEELSLTEIRHLVRANLGEQDASLSRVADDDTGTDTASLTKYINVYGNSIPGRLGSFMRMEGKVLQSGKLWPYFWHTKATTSAGTITISGNTITFPLNMDKIISLYDNQLNLPIEVIDRPERYNLARYKRKAPGNPEVVEVLGSDPSSRQVTGTLIPTPDDWDANCELAYYRIPARLDPDNPSTSYPDAPPQWHELWVVGTTMTLMRSDDPAYKRYAAREQELIVELLRVARML